VPLGIAPGSAPEGGVVTGAPPLSGTTDAEAADAGAGVPPAGGVPAAGAPVPGVPVPAAGTLVAAPLAEVGVPAPAVLTVVAPFGTMARGAYRSKTGPPPTVTVLATFPVPTSITVKVFWVWSATKASFPSELNVTSLAPPPIGIVVVTFRWVRSSRATSLLG